MVFTTAPVKGEPSLACRSKNLRRAWAQHPARVLASFGAAILAQPILGSIAIDLQDSAIAIQMPGDAIARSTVLEPIGHYGRS